MSVETLKADLKANLQTLQTLDPLTVSASDLARHLKETLWPFLESVVDETGEIDDCMSDLIEGAEDILQPETAQVFAAVLAGALACAQALRVRISRETDPQLSKVLDELESNISAAESIMAEIVIDPRDADDDDDEPADDDEGDDAVNDNAGDDDDH